MQYLYTKAGLEQNVILRSQLPPPSEFSLNPASTRLQVLTEFFDPPSPLKETRLLAGNVTDESLSFGAMKMARGQALSVGAAGESAEVVPVTKQWSEASGRTFLVEEVPFELVERQIALLDRKKEGASLSPRPGGEGTNVLAALAGSLPKRTAQTAPGQIRLARLGSYERPGFVLDYTILSGTNNFTLDTGTWYVSGTVNLGGQTVLGSAVVKFTNTASAKINITGSVTCRTGPFRPAVFTAKDDDSTGEVLPGSSGHPSGSYGYMLATSEASLNDCRFAYANRAISTSGALSLTNVQFVACGTPIYGDSDGITVTVDNGLFWANGIVFDHGHDQIFQGAYLTVDQSGSFFTTGDSPNCSLYLTNCLLVGLSSWGKNIDELVTNQVAWLSAGTGVFQAIGAGLHYLTNSTYRDLGTTDINPSLLAALKLKTTYPPVAITTNITADTVLSPQATRDSGTPDLGFHYDPLDFVVASVTLSNATLTLTNGVVLGTSPGSNANPAILYLGGSVKLISDGSPVLPNRLVRYNTVQEQSVTNAPNTGVFVHVDSSATAPELRCRFTDWQALSGAGDHLIGYNVHSPFSFNDCQFTASQVFLKGWPVAFTNCLWEGVSVNLNDDEEAVDRFIYNNLFRGGTLTLVRNGSGAAQVRDTLFDRTTLAQTGTITHDHNGYVTNANRLTPNGSGDVVLTNVPAYQASTLGNYYYPTNDGMLSRLIDAGSRPADDAGLYHFTTHTNQVKETNSVVEIGFHYVALTNGIPTDTDGDGIPDFLDPDSTPLTDIAWSNAVWFWKPNSLAWNCWTNAMACTNGLTGNFSNMFTSDSPIDTRNTNFWFRRYTGWPAYSVWNNCSTGGTNLWPTNGANSCGTASTFHGAGVLISPEHFLMAGHNGFGSNTWLAFMDMSNNVVFRQVQDYFYNVNCGDPPTANSSTNMTAPPFCDYYIGLLDQPVPDTIGFARVFPTNWWAWFDASFLDNASNHTYHVPMFVENYRDRKPVMKDLDYLDCAYAVRHQVFSQLALTNWIHASITNGDSGSPIFLALDGELCLAILEGCSINFGLGYESDTTVYLRAAMDAGMRELSLRNGRTNIYSLSVKDLGKYPQYGRPYNCPP